MKESYRRWLIMMTVVGGLFVFSPTEFAAIGWESLNYFRLLYFGYVLTAAVSSLRLVQLLRAREQGVLAALLHGLLLVGLLQLMELDLHSLHYPDFVASVGFQVSVYLVLIVLTILLAMFPLRLGNRNISLSWYQRVIVLAIIWLAIYLIVHANGSVTLNILQRLYAGYIVLAIVSSLLFAQLLVMRKMGMLAAILHGLLVIGSLVLVKATLNVIDYPLFMQSFSVQVLIYGVFLALTMVLCRFKPQR